MVGGTKSGNESLAGTNPITAILIGWTFRNDKNIAKTFASRVLAGADQSRALAPPCSLLLYFSNGQNFINLLIVDQLLELLDTASENTLS